MKNLMRMALALLASSCAANDAANHAATGAATGAAAPAIDAEPSAPLAATKLVHVPGTYAAVELVWVEAAGLWVGRTEVAWDEYLLFCDFEERMRGEEVWGAVDGMARPSRPLDVEPYDRGWGKGRRPAIGVSRQAAMDYCTWLSALTELPFRLPSEQEWLAACAPSEADRAVPLDDRAWTASNSDGRTHPIGTRAANDRGVFDGIGNASEYVSTPAVPDDDEWPLLLGGSMASELGDADAPPRQAFDFSWTLRDSNYPPGRWWLPDGDAVGFRVVCELPPPGA